MNDTDATVLRSLVNQYGIDVIAHELHRIVKFRAELAQTSRWRALQRKSHAFWYASSVVMGKAKILARGKP